MIKPPLAVVSEVRTKTVFALEHQVRRLDGNLGWTFSRRFRSSMRAARSLNGSAASDITERKQTEENLAIFSGCRGHRQDGMWIGRAHVYNPDARLVGKRPEDALGEVLTYHTSDFVTKLDEVIRPTFAGTDTAGELKLVSRDAAISTSATSFPC